MEQQMEQQIEPIEPITQKPSRVSKSLLILIVVLLMALSGVLGYFIHDFGDKEVANTTSVPIATNTQVPTSKNDLEKKSEEPTTKPQSDLPVVVFMPDTFSEAEKTQLNKNVINPMKDYELETRDNPEDFVAIVVEKLNEPSAGYTYRISSYGRNNSWGGFLYGNASDGTIPIWVPSCLGECKFSANYKQKYPLVIDKYNINK